MYMVYPVVFHNFLDNTFFPPGAMERTKLFFAAGPKALGEAAGKQVNLTIVVIYTQDGMC